MPALLPLLLLLAPASLAQEPPGAPPPAEALGADDTARESEAPPDDADPGAFGPVPTMEVIITAQPVGEAREALTERLEDMGYEEGKRRGDRVIYSHPVAWKPRVIVYDSGFMVLRRQPPRVRAPNRPGSLVGDKPVIKWAPCLLIPTLCVQAGGVFISPARFDRQKELVVASTTDSVRGLSDAITAEAMTERLNIEVPALLDAIWHQGVHPDDGRPLPTPPERRAAMLEFWESRADNTYGDAVRQTVEAYMIFEVQPSPWPFTPEEIAQTNATRHCQRELVLEE